MSQLKPIKISHTNFYQNWTSSSGDMSNPRMFFLYFLLVGGGGISPQGVKPQKQHYLSTQESRISNSSKSKILKYSPSPHCRGNFPTRFNPPKVQSKLPKNLAYKLSSKTEYDFRIYTPNNENNEISPSFGGNLSHGDLSPKRHKLVTQGSDIPNYTEFGPVLQEISPRQTDTLTD